MDFPDNTPSKPSKFRTKNWLEITNDSLEMYSSNSQIKFKASVLKSSLCGYSNTYIDVKGTISISNKGTLAAPNNRNQKVILKNYGPFIGCVTKINNTQVDDAKYIDVLMITYDWIVYSDNYSQTLRSLWQCYRDESLNNANDIIDFPANNNSVSFKFR